MKLLVAFSLATLLAAPAVGEHFTARFLTDTGRPFKGERLVFSPTSFNLAALVDDGQIHVFHVATGRETKKLPFRPIAFAFTPSGHQLLAVGERLSVLMPADDRPAIDAPWAPPHGYLGITFAQASGKIVIEAMAPNGPAAQSGELQIGDEIVGVVVGGEVVSVLGRTIPEDLQKLAGLAGTNVTLRIIPHGTVTAKLVTLRRVLGTKQNNQITFQPMTARSSPSSLVVRYGDSLLVLDSTEATPISAIQPIDIGPFGFQTFSSDGNLLAVAAHRRQKPVGEPELALEVHDVARQERLLFAPIDASTILEQRFTADGKRILFGTKDRILVYDLVKREFAPPILVGYDPSRHRPTTEPENDEEFSPLNTGLGLSNLNPSMEQQAAEAAKRGEYAHQLLASFDVSPDGKMVAVGSCHGELRLWATTEHKQLAKVGKRTLDQEHVKPVTFSPDGEWLAYYIDGTLHWQTVKSILAE